MPSVPVTDVAIRSRNIELPGTCPGCHRPLHAEGALKVWGFADESRSGRLRGAGDEDSVGGLVLGHDVPRGGETFIDNVAISCRYCDHVFVEGKFTAWPAG
jgi:hypothetical protein